MTYLEKLQSPKFVKWRENYIKRRESQLARIQAEWDKEVFRRQKLAEQKEDKRLKSILIWEHIQARRKIVADRLVNNYQIKIRRAAGEIVRLDAQTRNANLRSRIRSRISSAVKRQRAIKSARTAKLLGCSIKTFKKYIEARFKPGMTWENYGPVWHIDHIRPCSSFDLTKADEQKTCFNYKNTQPLFALENLQKSNKWPSKSSAPTADAEASGPSDAR